jgi:hypothetical protein
MSSLALVTSPFQLISLKEYLFENELEGCRILVLCQKDKLIQGQLEKTAEILELELSEFIYFDSFFQSHYFRLKREINVEIDTLILGHLFSEPVVFVSNLIPYKRLIILDDGLSSIKIPEIFHNKLYLDESKPALNKIIKKFLLIDAKLPAVAEFFTLFKMKNTDGLEISKNRLNYLKTFLSEKSISNQGYFIGQPFVENGELEMPFYLSLVEGFVKENSQNFSELVYIAHRKEGDSKLRQIESISKNIRTVRFNVSLEIELATTKYIPSVIVGISSTALITLKTMFSHIQELQFFSINIPKNKFLLNGSKHLSHAEYVKNFEIPSLTIGTK